MEDESCPICGGDKFTRGFDKPKKNQPTQNTCSDIICIETAKRFNFRIRLKAGQKLPLDYWNNDIFCNSSGFAKYENTLARWKWWEHKKEIQNRRAEVMALMYLNGQIGLSKEAIPYLDKNYCKPIKYKQSIKRFSYEKHKSNSDTLRNYGWSDLLLSGTAKP